jgi:hypothetical protein
MNIDRFVVQQQGRKVKRSSSKLVRYMAINNRDMMSVIRREGAADGYGDQPGEPDAGTPPPSGGSGAYWGASD